MVREVARPVSRLFGDLIFRNMYRWQVARFFGDAEVRAEFLPLLYQQFVTEPTAHAAFCRPRNCICSRAPVISCRWTNQ
jgi:hypothetical protein